jgi:hypothetical protein
MFQQEEQNEQPYLQAGYGALSQIQNNMGYYQQPFGMAQFQEDPGYQFDLQQGQQALQTSSAAQGGIVSGGEMAALNNYSQNMASNEYQNAYNRYVTNQTNSFNRLATLAGLGQTANQTTTQAGTQTAAGIANTQTSLGSAQGAAQIAQGNAISGAIGSGTNGILNASMLSALQGNGANTQAINNAFGSSSAPQFTMPNFGADYASSQPTSTLSQLAGQ